MDAPKLPSIFRNVRREPKRFGYRPKFYDPAEEEREERRKRIEEELAREQGKAPERPLKVNFRTANRRNSFRGAALGSSLRMIVILVILMILLFSAVRWLESF